MPTHPTATRLRRGLIAGLIGLAMALTPISSAAAAEDEVDIPDPAFRTCLSTVLKGLPLTADNLGTLKSVVCPADGSTIRSIAGAQYLTSATTLALHNSLLLNLSPIAALPQLAAFRSGLHPDSDVTALASLENLQLLEFSPVSKAQDLHVISELGRLGWLGLNTSDTHLPGLGGSAEADRVSVSGSNLTSLDGLQGLNAGLLQVTGADKLANLTALRGSRITEVRMGNSRGTPDIEPLKDVAGLEVLSVQVSGTAQVGKIRHLTSLRELDFSGSGLTDLSTLQPPPTLERLSVSSYSPEHGYDLAELGPVGSLRQLKELRAWYARGVTSLEALRGTTSLTSLVMPGSGIHDLSPLSGLPDGATLDLSGNQIVDFSPLKGWSGNLSATNQVYAVTDMLPGTSVEIDVRGPDGRYLAPAKNADAPCTYTYALTCTRGGEHFLYFTGGDSVSIRLYAMVEYRYLKVTAPPSTGRGAVKPGTTLTIQPGTWSPKPEHFTYQWFRGDHTPIPGATTASYRTTDSEYGAVWAEVTGHLHGYDATTVQSTVVSVTTGGQVGVVTPTIRFSGRLATDTVLSTAEDTFDPATTFTYQWQRDKKNIAGATAPTYKVRASDVGHKLRVRVTGSKEGYDSSTAYSVHVTPAKAKFAASSKPTIAGTKAVGKKLTATVNWSPTATLKYQWYRNGKKVQGATKATYTLKASDRNDRFTVRVTASKSGYTTVAKTSSKTAKIKKGILTPGTATITGTPVAGKKLTAKSTAWTPGKVTLSYRWYRDGKTIKGATSRHYTVKKADASHALTVRITGKKSGYTTKSIKSSAMTANSKG